MAALQAALGNYLNDVLAITDVNVRQAIFNQGVDSLSVFADLTQEEVKTLCYNVRKPGGTIPNPNAGNAGAPAVIPNPGVTLGFIHEKRLKMLAYFGYHQRRVQRAFTAASASLANLTRVWNLKTTLDEEEEAADELKLPEPLTKLEDARTAIEDIDNYLQRKRGVSGCPLAYVVRDFQGLPLDDPGPGLPTPDKEMIDRAPHTGESYASDNKEVWSVIRHMTHGGPAWNWISQFARTTNGRDAYRAIKSHYLGKSFQEKIKSSADKTIETTFYDGKSRFSFEKYCAIMNRAFEDQAEAGEPSSDSRKVRFLLKGIRDPKLETAKNQVIATDGLNTDFNSAVNYISQVNDTVNSYRESLRTKISSITSKSGRGGGRGRGYSGRGGGRGQGKGGRGSSRNPYLGYYSSEEWAKLPPEQQSAIRQIRNEQKEKKKLKSQIAELTTKDTDHHKEDDKGDKNDKKRDADDSDVGTKMSRRRTDRG